MPAGASWGVYTRFFIGCFIATYAGSQTVHKIYKPLDDVFEPVHETWVQCCPFIMLYLEPIRMDCVGFQEAVNEEKRRILKEESEALERKAQQKLGNTV